jgi:5-methylcytosine-specific restriction protein A
MEITEEMTREGYLYAKKVYEGLISRKNAVDHLASCGMNAGSASDYMQNFKCMIEGKRYTRTNNAFATDYFLKNILDDYGTDRLRDALFAVDQHIAYYKKVRGVTLYGIRGVYEKYLLYLEKHQELLYPDEISHPEQFREGLKKQVTVNVFERDPRARDKCKAHHGISCSACGFNFEEIYGDLGSGYIHIHHLTQLSTIGKEYQVDPVKEMRPVCPNCHAMLHRQTPPLTIDELKAMMKR